MKLTHSLRLLFLLPLVAVLLLTLVVVYLNMSSMTTQHDHADYAQRVDLQTIAKAAQFSQQLGDVQLRLSHALDGASNGAMNALQLYRTHSALVNELEELATVVQLLAESELLLITSAENVNNLLESFEAYRHFVIMTSDALAVSPAVAGHFLEQSKLNYVQFSMLINRIEQDLAERALERSREHAINFEQLIRNLTLASLSMLVVIFALALFAVRRASSNMMDIADGLSRLARSTANRIELPRIEYLHQHSRAELKQITGKLLDFRHALQRQREAEEKAYQLSYFDPLTHLPNRRLLRQRLTQALSESERHQKVSALLVLDLDAFKQINDTRGHAAGDQVLVEVGKRLSGALSRIDGNAFAVLLPALSDSKADAAQQAGQIGEQLAQLINQPVLLDGEPTVISACFGITLMDASMRDPAVPFKQAETAMYRAKDEGRGRIRFFDRKIQERQEMLSKLEFDLRWAIEQEQLQLFYQLQVNAARQVQGVEALLRWRHPERGMVAPNEFISLAEASDLILPIGRWVLHAACRQLAAWAQDARYAHLSLSINVSPRQFRQSNFIDSVRQALEDNNVRPEKLKLEITESLAIRDVEQTIAKMEALRELGVRLSLDDFGTGYSSLQYLKRLPLDQLKIEQSFARDITHNKQDAAIVQAIITLGRTLDIEVIAEGVETAEQEQLLFRQGCQLYQGYLYSKPLPLQELEELLNSRYRLCDTG